MYLKKFKINKQNLLSFSILMFALFPLIPNRIKGLPVVFLFIVSVFFYKKKRIDYKWLIINSSLYLTYLLFFLFSNNRGEIGRLLETSLSILIMPIIFNVFISDIRFNKQLKIKFYNFFIFSSFVFSLIILSAIIFDNSTIYYSNWYTNKARTIIENYPVIGQHPIYASLFFSISILFATDVVKNFNLKGFKLRIYYFSIFFNIILLLFFLSKGVILALLVTLFSLFFLTSKWSKKKTLILLSSIILISCLFLFNRRMNELINLDTYKKVDINYSTGLRVGIYKCVFDLIPEKWIMGYGPGNTQQVLDSCYATKSTLLLEKTYNSHNQYFDVLLKTGIFGFLVFIYFLRISYIRAKNNNNFIATYIILFFSIVLFIENLLLRQTGVILFYFFITFFSKFINNHNLEKYKDAATKYI